METVFCLNFLSQTSFPASSLIWVKRSAPFRSIFRQLYAIEATTLACIKTAACYLPSTSRHLSLPSEHLLFAYLWTVQNNSGVHWRYGKIFVSFCFSVCCWCVEGRTVSSTWSRSFPQCAASYPQVLRSIISVVLHREKKAGNPHFQFDKFCCLFLLK